MPTFCCLEVEKLFGSTEHGKGGMRLRLMSPPEDTPISGCDWSAVGMQAPSVPSNQ
jgi:hypothetical protein